MALTGVSRVRAGGAVVPFAVDAAASLLSCSTTRVEKAAKFLLVERIRKMESLVTGTSPAPGGPVSFALRGPLLKVSIGPSGLDACALVEV